MKNGKPAILYEEIIEAPHPRSEFGLKLWQIIEEFNQALNLQKLFVKLELSKFNENSMHWI